jgi:hypothetical protein
VKCVSWNNKKEIGTEQLQNKWYDGTERKKRV